MVFRSWLVMDQPAPCCLIDYCGYASESYMKMNPSTTKIYFKINWIFNDGRSSPTNDRIFGVDISNNILKSLPNLMEDDDRIHLSTPIFEAFKREFPEFNEEEYKLEALGN